MNRDEFLALEDNKAMAKYLNDQIDAGKTPEEVQEELGLTKKDLTEQALYLVRGKFLARAWGGYTTTKRTGNEARDSANGVGDSDPSKGYNGI
ncbi:MAG: hypothetical protein SOI38_09100 [Eggerthellaceae bacterium]|jgi:hypothetical protein